MSHTGLELRLRTSLKVQASLRLLSCPGRVYNGSAEWALCIRAGMYNEQVFKAMDFVLDQASQHGMRAIVALTDYWKVTDGVQQVRIW